MTIRKSDKQQKKWMTKESARSFMVDLLWIIVGCTIGAVAVVGIMEPNGLSSGGIVGIIRILQRYVSLDFSVMYYIAAAIVIVIMWIGLGFRSVRRAIIVACVYPTIMFVIERFQFSILEEKDLILAAIFCGVLQGISIGLIFWRGYTFPGSDGIAKVIRKRFLPHVSQGKIMSVIDAGVIIASAFVYDRNIALYALVTQVIITKTIDIVIYGFESQIVQLEIITSKEQEVADYILNDIHRGVTRTMVKGEYSQRELAELRLLCSSRESVDLRKAVAKIDPSAFVTLHKIDNVWGEGEGFKDLE